MRPIRLYRAEAEYVTFTRNCLIAEGGKIDLIAACLENPVQIMSTDPQA